MDNTIYIVTGIYLFVQLLTAWLFYKGERKFALPVGVLLLLFSWSSMSMLGEATSMDIIIIMLLVFFIQLSGNIILLKGPWQKAVVVSFISNAVPAGLIFLIDKFAA